MAAARHAGWAALSPGERFPRNHGERCVRHAAIRVGRKGRAVPACHCRLGSGIRSRFQDLDVPAECGEHLMICTSSVTLGRRGGGMDHGRDVAATLSAPVTKTSSVPALERGLAILEAVAKSRSGLTLSQL